MSSTLDLFTELCAIPSPPGNERAVTDRVAAELRTLGIEVEEDDAGARIDSNAGNLLCRLPGPDGRRYADLPLRAPRHRAATGRPRARRHGRGRP